MKDNTEKAIREAAVNPKIGFGDSFITIKKGMIWFDQYNWGMSARLLHELYHTYVSYNNQPFGSELTNKSEKEEGWISCKERLPEERGLYLVIGQEDSDWFYSVEVYDSDKSKWLDTRGTGAWDFTITHWMPLPKAPTTPKE